MGQLTTDQYYNNLKQAATYVSNQSNHATGNIAIVLGSGLNNFAAELHNSISISYSSIPHMPITGVSGHDGKLVIGKLRLANNTDGIVYCWSGRVHAYEGWSSSDVNYIVRLSYMCGINTLILTNSAGGSLHGMVPGSIMVLNDHMRLCNFNAINDVIDDSRLVHTNHRYCNTQRLYNNQLKQIILDSGKLLNLSVLEGCYTWTGGPTYETPSEVQCGMLLNGGAFGMSTIPELIAAQCLNMNTVAMSLCTNLAAGLADEVLTHEDVKVAAAMAAPNFTKLLLSVFSKISIDNTINTLPINQSLLQQYRQSLLSTQRIELTSTPTPLPTIQDIQTGINELHSNTRINDQPAISIFVFGQLLIDALLSQLHLSDIRILSFQNLSYIYHNTHTSSARHAQLIHGYTNNNQSIYVIASNALEGFDTFESSYIVQLLASLNVSTLLFASEAQQLNNNLSDHILIMDDILDRTMQPTLYPVHSAFVNRHSRNISLNSSSTSFKSGCYVAFDGPNTPSTAELNTARIAIDNGNGAAGITSVSVIASALQLGITVNGICVVTADAAGNFVNPPTAAYNNASQWLIKSIESGTTNKSINIDLDSILVTDAPPTDIPPVPLSLTYDCTQHAAASLKQKLNNILIDTAFIVAGCLSSVLSDFHCDVTIPCEDIESWDSVTGTLQYPYQHSWCNRWMLCSGKLYNKNIIVFTTTNNHTEFELPLLHGLQYMIRLFHAINIQYITLLSPYTSIQQSSSQQIVCISDHINLSGSNLLVGDNDERWGRRFPDMSDAYNNTIRNKLQEYAQQNNIDLKQSIAAYTVASITNSNALRRLMKHVKADVVVNGVVPLTIVARHMGINVTALGYTVYGNDTNATDANVKSLTSLMQHLLT